METFFAPWIDFWKRYFDFEGVTSRRDYWITFLINTVVFGVLGGVLGVFGTVGVTISSLISLAAIIPGLAICVRRLRDAGYKWTSLFLALIPLVGVIILIIRLCKPSAAPIVAE